ncbi:MAG: hypothetical protein AAGF45_06110 [Pseudomonadota bacterium]
MAVSLGQAGRIFERVVERLRPTSAAQRREKSFVAAIAPLVDERFYLAHYPDVRASGTPAALHYVREGWRRGYDPAPWFSSSDYAAINADVGDGEMPPFVHYALHGRGEGRTIMPTRHVRPREDTRAEIAMAAPRSSDLLSLRARARAAWEDALPPFAEKSLVSVHKKAESPAKTPD